ncbi:MAG: ABC transporter ATP-binding protein [Oscillospiraceae bacterium]
MIELSHVTKTFGGATRALDDLTLNVPQGAVYGLVGSNGAGKTTAIRHITGIFRQDSGSVTIGGLPVYENPAVKSRIGYIPDDLGVFGGGTLRELAAFYRTMYPRFDAKRYAALRDVFRLDEATPLRRFSKGMQKHAAFWLTLSMRPDYLVLDEPVDGLDPVMRRQIWSLASRGCGGLRHDGAGIVAQSARAGGHLRPCRHHAHGPYASGAVAVRPAGQFRQGAARDGEPAAAIAPNPA